MSLSNYAENKVADALCGNATFTTSVVGWSRFEASSSVSVALSGMPYVTESLSTATVHVSRLEGLP